MRAAPLSDLVVLELASVLAGPSAGQFLAELGARVIKLENVRTDGDVTRQWTLPDEDPIDGVSAYFSCCNWGKESVAVDLKSEEGRHALYKLAATTDVVLSSYRPGAARKLGADYETLRDGNPRLIYLHLTGYGAESERPGYDAVIQAEAGYMHMNGSPDGPPTKMPVALMDVLAAHQLKEALLLALLHRERTGEGTHTSISLFDCAVSGLANQATNYLVAGHVPRRMGSAHPNIAPYGTSYPTRDGAVVLAVGTDRQFARLSEVLGCSELSRDERYRTNAARVRHRTELDERLAAEIGARRRDELLDELQAAGVPAGAVRDVEEVFETPDARRLVLRDQSAVGLRQVAFTSRSPGTTSDLLPPPRYGEHTRSVLEETLSLSADEVVVLEERGVIYCGGR